MVLGLFPTARELGQIYALIEAYIRVITASEMLKSLFVFAAFNIDALLPPPNLAVLEALDPDYVLRDDDPQSFYAQYITQQVIQRITQNTQGEFLFALEKYMIETYAKIKNVETGRTPRGLSSDNWKINFKNSI